MTLGQNKIFFSIVVFKTWYHFFKVNIETPIEDTFSSCRKSLGLLSRFTDGVLSAYMDTLRMV